MRRHGERFYGRRKMTALLRRAGHDVSERRVGRLMRLARMKGLRRGKAPKTTVPAGKPSAGDLLDRRFFADAPNRRWVTDLTYVKARTQGWVYTSFIT
ncbi:MAG: IS3 family transposase, partial [Bifidobacteriaceae bacterium]|nr:IS3 family transposase [Bifidobacteriaceae bacterium]